MLSIDIERLQVTAADGTVNINYERTHITWSATDDITIVEPPGPIEAGPIISDAEEVVS